MKHIDGSLREAVCLCLVLTTLVGGFGLFGCRTSNTIPMPPDPQSSTPPKPRIVLESRVVPVGARFALRAEALDPSGRIADLTADVTWTTSGSESALIERVDGRPYVLARAPGRTTIVARTSAGTEVREEIEVISIAGAVTSVEFLVEVRRTIVGRDLRFSVRASTDDEREFDVTSIANFDTTVRGLIQIEPLERRIAPRRPGTCDARAIVDGIASSVVTLVVDGPDSPVDGERTNEIRRRGITWKFDEPVRWGRYVNGDYWVVGPVKIVGINPRSTELNGRIRHGSAIDVGVRGAVQPWDSELYGEFGGPELYDANQNIAFGLDAANPVELRPGQRLISTRSDLELANEPLLGLSGAAVLTCVRKPVPDDAFRPAAVGRPGPLRRVSDLALDRLPQLELVLAGGPILRDLEARLDGLWLEHVPEWLAAFTHPRDNMPRYGRDLASVIGTASLIAASDLPLERKRPILLRLVQIGIDFDGAYRDGCAWPPSGGNSIGRKWPIIFTRALFGDRDPMPVEPERFTEDGQTFRVRRTEDGAINFGFGGYGPEHIGMPEWATRYWTSDPIGERSDLNWDADPYRHCCTFNALAGHILVCRAMSLEKTWNWSPALDYMDRYMQIETSGWRRQFDAWSAQMWDRHRASIGEPTEFPTEWLRR